MEDIGKIKVRLEELIEKIKIEEDNSMVNDYINEFVKLYNPYMLYDGKNEWKIIHEYGHVIMERMKKKDDMRLGILK